jgi:hypothetical protein
VDAGYNGTIDFAYQIQSRKGIWSDYDAPGWVWEGQVYHYRDNILVYPTSSGVIDTIQWVGGQEGIDDTHYLATLIKFEG